jgi:hypothetical protein
MGLSGCLCAAASTAPGLTLHSLVSLQLQACNGAAGSAAGPGLELVYSVLEAVGCEV